MKACWIGCGTVLLPDSTEAILRLLASIVAPDTVALTSPNDGVAGGCAAVRLVAAAHIAATTRSGNVFISGVSCKHPAHMPVYICIGKRARIHNRRQAEALMSARQRHGAGASCRHDTLQRVCKQQTASTGGERSVPTCMTTSLPGTETFKMHDCAAWLPYECIWRGEVRAL